MKLRSFTIGLSLLATGTFIGAATQQFASADISSGDRPVLVPIETCRLTDTRSEPNTVGPRDAPLGPAETLTVDAQQVGTDCTGQIPSGATALSLNVTALNATSNSFITMWPDGPRPTASALNPEPGTRVFNAVTTELSPTQTFEIYNNRGAVDVFVDINGYYDNHNHDDTYYPRTAVDALVAPATSTEHLSIPAAAFQARFTTANVQPGNPAQSSLRTFVDSTGGDSSLLAPVLLPDGATIVSISFGLLDEDPGEDLSGWLWRNELDDPTSTQLAEATTTGASSTIQLLTDTSVEGPTVDNSRFVYWLEVGDNSWASSPNATALAVASVSIEYTIER